VISDDKKLLRYWWWLKRDQMFAKLREDDSFGSGQTHLYSYLTDLRARLDEAQGNREEVEAEVKRLQDHLSTAKGSQMEEKYKILFHFSSLESRLRIVNVRVDPGIGRAITMPPGYWMKRIANGLFFFSPKTVERVFGEIIADYRHEMIEAEAKRKPPAEMRWLRIRHWGGFLLAVFEEMYLGTVGKIVKVFKGS
jgi:hypothetical protein